MTKFLEAHCDDVHISYAFLLCACVSNIGFNNLALLENNLNKTVCHQCQAPYVELTEYKLTERLVLDLVLELALDLVLDLVLELALDLVLDLELDLDLDFWNILEAFKPF